MRILRRFVIIICLTQQTAAVSAATPSSGRHLAWTSTETPVGYSADSLVKQTYVYAVKGADTLRLDVYYNPTAKWLSGSRRLVILFSFGGGWEAGARADGAGTHTPFLNTMARYGYVGVGIDYRLGYLKARRDGRVEDVSIGHYLESKEYTPEVFGAVTEAIETGAEDIYSATSFIIENADEWGADPDCIILAGASAGGCNSLAAALGELSGLPAGFRYAGVIAGCGALWYVPDDAAETVMPSDAPVLKRTDQDPPCPILFVHGDADNLVPFDGLSLPGVGRIDGSRRLADYFRLRGWPYEMITGRGGGHSFGGEQFQFGHDFVNRFILDYIIDR